MNGWSADDIRRRFPQFAVRDNEIGYFEPEAGFVRPETCDPLRNFAWRGVAVPKCTPRKRSWIGATKERRSA